jgi:hypothetical protein
MEVAVLALNGQGSTARRKKPRAKVTSLSSSAKTVLLETLMQSQAVAHPISDRGTVYWPWQNA